MDIHWEFVLCLRKLKRGLCIKLEGCDGEGKLEGRFKREGMSPKKTLQEKRQNQLWLHGHSAWKLWAT